MKKMKRRILAGILLLLAVACIWSLYQSKYGLSVTSYEISSRKVTDSIQIVQLTDLHNSEFGEENRRLVETVRAQEPDLILITGDLVDSGSSNTEIAVHLIENLCTIAPVYVSYGNHELEYDEAYLQGADGENSGQTGFTGDEAGEDGANGTVITSLEELYESAGAVVLEREYVDITVNGQELRIGGIYGYCVPAKYLVNNGADSEECAFLSDFQDTDRYTILLCHMPVCWTLNDGINEWNVDAVFAGHVHGGQIIFPWIGGVYGPDYGWFPGHLEGLFYSREGEKVVVLSRGLGSTEWVPRLNNIPEVVMVDLLSAEQG